MLWKFLNLKHQLYVRASFSLLVILLGSEGHWTLDRSALINPYRAVATPRESGAARYKLISNIITGARINHGAPGASGLLVEINEVINIHHLMASWLLSSSSNMIIIPREFAIIFSGRDAE